MQIPSSSRLHYFRAVVEAGSIRTAARRLSIAASAISRQMKLLEEELGGPVLERTRHGIRPTELGLLLLGHCYRVASLEQGFRHELEHYHQLEAGMVSICAGEGFVSEIIEKPIKTFAQQYSGITLELDVGSTSDIVQSLLHDSSHIGVMYQGDAHPELHYWYSSPQPLVCLMSPDYSLAINREPVSFSTLASHPLILWRQGYGVRHLVDEGFRMASTEPLNRVETNSLMVIRRMLIQGLGISLLPACAAADALNEGTLLARPVDSQIFFQAQAHIVTRVGRSLPRAGLQLLRHLGQWMQNFHGGTQVR